MFTLTLMSCNNFVTKRLYLDDEKLKLLNATNKTCSVCLRCLHGNTGLGRVAQSVARLTQEPEVPGSISVPVTYFCFFFG